MGRFDSYKTLLKDFSAELEAIERMRANEIASAKERFNESALPDELKSIKAEHDKMAEGVRDEFLSKLSLETKRMEHKNMDKFIPNYIDDTLLTELNLVSAAGIPLTESEIEAYTRKAMESRSDFCVRKVVAMAKTSGFRLNVPSEQAACEIISKTNDRIKKIIEKYDGNPATGYLGNPFRDQSIVMDAKGGFLNRNEKEYEQKMVEDISISRLSPLEYEKRQNASKDQEEIEIVETGHLGVTVKPDTNTGAAVAYLREKGLAKA